jgi:Fe-S cluster assembly scaffold protein SufB
LLLRNGEEKQIIVYEYQVTIFESKDEKYRGINTAFITSYERSFIYTPEAIKNDLIVNRREFPNPAVYHIESDITFPLEQTLLPLAKRSLVKHISTAA